MKKVDVIIGAKNYTIIDNSGSDDVNIYIPGLCQLMLVDYRDKKDDFLADVLEDIKMAGSKYILTNFYGLKPSISRSKAHTGTTTLAQTMYRHIY